MGAPSAPVDLHYPAILNAVLETPWAIQHEKLRVIASFLAAKAAGHEVDPAVANVIIGGGDIGRGPIRVGSTAIIPVWGTITYRADALLESSGMTSTQRLTKWLRDALDDSEVKSIVLDINSPGGTAPGVNEFAEEVRRGREKKKIVGYANWLAASAAYWILAQCTECWMLPSGYVGSVGVFSMHVDFSQALEKEGIRVTFVHEGKYKTEENPYQPLSKDAQEAMQERVSATYEAFVKAVAKGRGVSPAKVRSDYGQGRVMRPEKALEAGMVDRVGTMDELLQRLDRGKRGGTLRADGNASTELAALLRVRAKAWE